MRTIRGPGLFLSQFIADAPPFNTLDGLAGWAAPLGAKGVQVPILDSRVFDIGLAATSDAYCDEVRGTLAHHGIEIAELASHRAGHLMAVHPGADLVADRFAPPELRGNPAGRRAWAERMLRLAAQASRRLGLSAHATFSGALLWPMFYPFPPYGDGLIADGFAELARRWRPVLDAFEEAGVDLCFELHPGEDLHDGASFERFLDAVGGHARAKILYDPSHMLLQQMDYAGFIDIYHARIGAFHVKDAEYRPSARSGVYGGFQPWLDRAGRFRSPGDGMIDFGVIFSKLAQYDYPGWAVLEWECVLKNSQDGAREGIAFIRDHIIRVTGRAFDANIGAAQDRAANAAILGIARDD
ncbi:MAG: sugar phosphate isomerase/epimerase [Acetobacteraceae bacterium]|nr:sugar phosphate isomerase/epimerase [Acetobacteraceae bacterium]